jgi:hypothetical protein
MAAVKSRFDDDDVFDAELHDPAFYPRLVYRDGKGPRVRLMMTDAAPPSRPALYDRAAHRPRYAVVDAADPAVIEAERAFRERNDYLRDAWRTQASGTGGAPHTTAPGADDDDDAKDVDAERAAYIDRISNAYKAGSYGGGNGDANAIEGQRRRWLSPGATPGSDAAMVTKDAAVADRDQAYGEYLNRICNGWRR